MKKIISVLLVCAMLLSFGVVVSANGTDDTATENTIEVAQSDGMTYAQINAELVENGDAGAYDWSGAVSLSGTPYGEWEGDAQFKVTHAGDYLYIYTHVPTLYAFRTQSEEFVYVDLDIGDGDVDYIIVMKPNYGPYLLNGTKVNYYQEGVVDRERQGDDANWGPPYNNTVNKGSGLELDILFGRNDYTVSKTVEEDCIYHIAIPLSEKNKTAIEDGTCNIGVGFAYIQRKTTGSERYYTNCGEFTLDNADNCGNDFYDDITEDKLTTLKLNKKTTTNVVDTNVVGVQTTPIGATGTTYSARFLATLNTADLTSESIGFRFIGDNTVDQDCYVVYSSVVANGETVSAQDLGGDYIYCIDLDDMVVGKAYDIQITSYHIGDDGEKEIGTIYKVSISDAGKITIEEAASAS